MSEDEVQYSPSRTNNYKTIRTISTIFKVLTWISVGLSVIAALGALGSLSSSYYGPGADFYLSLVFVFYGLASAVVFAFLSESVNVILDIEANSRQTVKALERILRSQG